MSNLVIANDTCAALDAAVNDGLIAQNEASRFKKMAMVAGSVGQLRDLLTNDVMKPIMDLQGTSIGFRTDKDTKGGYPLNVVKDCLIEATLSGVYPVGNEFNIISAKCYITKEGFGRKLRDIAGLSFTITPGIPKNQNGGAIVTMTIEWTYDGKQQTKNLDICVRVNNGMGTDAIIGKATRKARAWLFTTITGQEVGDGDADDAIDTTAKPVTSKFEIKKEPAKVAENTQPATQQGQEDLPTAEAPQFASLDEALDGTPISSDDVGAYCKAMNRPFVPSKIIANRDNVVNTVLNWLESQKGE